MPAAAVEKLAWDHIHTVLLGSGWNAARSCVRQRFNQARRIAWLPGAEDFLRRLRASGRRLVLLTNSHPRVLRIKDEQTGISRYLHALLSSHAFGVPKESADFWRAVREVEPFEPDRTLFIDDSPAGLGQRPRPRAPLDGGAPLRPGGRFCPECPPERGGRGR
ncbi:MAG: HAD-IA family hydrolase [Steroidobacteraceae bacterium]